MKQIKKVAAVWFLCLAFLVGGASISLVNAAGGDDYYTVISSLPRIGEKVTGPFPDFIMFMGDFPNNGAFQGNYADLAINGVVENGRILYFGIRPKSNISAETEQAVAGILTNVYGQPKNSESAFYLWEHRGKTVQLVRKSGEIIAN